MTTRLQKQPAVSQRQIPRNRFQPYKRARMRLEERDERLLCDLFLHRLMARSQIERLYFSSVVRCNARLRLLFDHGFVLRHFPPAAPFGAQAIYSVGKTALPVISRRLEMELPEVARYYRRTQTPTFIEHTLAVVDICMAFREATQSSETVNLDLWLAEMQCRHDWTIRAPGDKWRKEAFKPDGFVRLQTPSGYANFFIEADLGHTSSNQFERKLLTHQRYCESGLFEQTYGCADFRTLVITTGERRLKNLCAIGQEKDSDLFWFTTFKSLQNEGVLKPIWTVPLSDSLHPLVSLTHSAFSEDS